MDSVEQAYLTDEHTQNQITLELTLFMSSMGLKHGNYNYYFRQFISRIRPDFVLPSMTDFDLDARLNLSHTQTIEKMTEILAVVKRFTIMANVVKLDRDDFKFLCISLGFILNNQFDSLLLAVYELKPDKIKQMDSILPYVNKVLSFYNLNYSNIICTIFEGFEEAAIKSSQLSANNPFHFHLRHQIGRFIQEVIESSALAIRIRSETIEMAKRFSNNATARKEFSSICGYDIRNQETYDGLVRTLIAFQDQFIDICNRYSIQQINQIDWEALLYFNHAKELLKKCTKAFDGKKYCTIDSIVPIFNELCTSLKNTAHLGAEFINIEKEIRHKLGYILNPKNNKFHPIFIVSTFLNPNYCSILDEAQFAFAEIFVQDLADEYPQSNNGIETIMNLMITYKSRRIQRNVSSLIELYKMEAFNNNRRTNVLEFWDENRERLGNLSLLAKDLLSIPVSATLPFFSLASTYNTRISSDLQELFSITDPFDYIRCSTNVKDMPRNALIRLNQHAFEYVWPRDYSAENQAVSNSNDIPAADLYYNNTPILSPIRDDSLFHPPGFTYPERLDNYEVSEASNSDSEFQARDLPYDYANRDSRYRHLKRRHSSDSNSASSSSPSQKSSRPDFLCTSVLIVKNINQRSFDCHRLVNLFSIYGHVDKVKFVNKDSCMVQMNSAEEAQTVYNYLDGSRAFDTQLEIRTSKRTEIVHREKDTFKLRCGSSSFYQYSSVNMPFIPRPPASSELSKPSRKLMFFNLPISISLNYLQELMNNYDNNGPKPIKISQLESSNSDYTSGILEFRTRLKSVEALMIFNNMNLTGSYYLQLKFYNE